MRVLSRREFGRAASSGLVLVPFAGADAVASLVRSRRRRVAIVDSEYTLSTCCLKADR